MKRAPSSILKKNAFFTSNLAGALGMSGSINYNPARRKSVCNKGNVKKRVTFNLKTTVHEYEKQKQISEESSDAEEEYAV